MADKDDGITEPVEPTEPIVSAPEAEPQEPKPFEVPEDLKGKSPEEMAKMVLETRKKLGEQGQDLGTQVKDLKDTLERYRQEMDDKQRIYDMYASQVQQPAVDTTQYVPQKPEEKPVFDYERPIDSIESYLKQREEKQRAKAVRQSAQQAWNDGKFAFQQGRQNAIRSNPELYKGIEREVEQRVFQTYEPFARQGYSVKEYVADPKIWEKVAINVHIDQGNLDRVVSKKSKPMQATPTETPNPAKAALAQTSETAALDWNAPDVREMMKGSTPEEAMEIIREEQKRVERGEATDVTWRR